MSRASRDLTQGSVFGHLMRLVIPMSFGIVAMMLVGVIDAYWVGKLGTAQQAAVQFVFPVSMLVMSIAIGLGAGTVSVVARAAGKGDHSRTRRLATDAVGLSVIVVLAASIVGIALIDPVFRFMGATEEMMPHVRDYMTVWLAGVVFVVGPMVASNLLRALGDAILPSVIMIFAAVLNMILDPLLIFGFGPIPALEVTGAALATLLANLVVFAVTMAILVFREKLIDLSWPGWETVSWSWREIARIGAPAAGSNMINPIATTMVFSATARFGEAAVAGFGVAARVEALAIIPLFALSGSIGPITGQNGGAGRVDRVREAFRVSFLFCLGWSVFIALILFFLGGYLAPLFLPSEDGRAIAEFYWDIVPITIAGYGVAMAASAGFNGLGRPLYGVALNLLRGFALLAPLAWLGAMSGSAEGIVWGVAAANTLAGLLIAAFVLVLAPMDEVAGKPPTAAKTNAEAPKPDALPADPAPVLQADDSPKR